MKPITQTNDKEQEAVDFLKLLTLICHLETQYALHPCAPLAANINRHIKFLLNSSAADSLGEWQGTYEQLSIQWHAIADRHIQHRLKTEKVETRQVVTHIFRSR